MKSDYQYPAFRGFCYKHSERGNQSFEDNDDNYELLWGDPRRDTQNSDDDSPAAFLGAIDLT